MGLLASHLRAPEKAFVRALVRYGDIKHAGELAGVADPNRLIESDSIAHAIQHHTYQRLKALAPVALNVVVKVMLDETAPAHIRRLAASDILDRAGYTAKALGVAERDTTIPLADMTPATLRELVGRLELELSERSATVAGLVVDQSLADQTAKPLSALD